MFLCRLHFGWMSRIRSAPDRVVAAAAAYAVVGGAVAVADLGTAITIDLVDDNGIFLAASYSPALKAAPWR